MRKPHLLRSFGIYGRHTQSVNGSGNVLLTLDALLGTHSENLLAHRSTDRSQVIEPIYSLRKTIQTMRQRFVKRSAGLMGVPRGVRNRWPDNRAGSCPSIPSASDLRLRSSQNAVIPASRPNPAPDDSGESLFYAAAAPIGHDPTALPISPSPTFSSPGYRSRPARRARSRGSSAAPSQYRS